MWWAWYIEVNAQWSVARAGDYWPDPMADELAWSWLSKTRAKGSRLRGRWSRDCGCGGRRLAGAGELIESSGPEDVGWMQRAMGSCREVVPVVMAVEKRSHYREGRRRTKRVCCHLQVVRPSMLRKVRPLQKPLPLLFFLKKKFQKNFFWPLFLKNPYCPPKLGKIFLHTQNPTFTKIGRIYIRFLWKRLLKHNGEVENALGCLQNEQYLRSKN